MIQNLWKETPGYERTTKRKEAEETGNRQLSKDVHATAEQCRFYFQSVKKNALYLNVTQTHIRTIRNFFLCQLLVE